MREHPQTKIIPTAAGFWSAALLITTLVLPFHASASDLVSVPAASFSPPASGGGDSFVSCASPDGRYVLFSSTANNLAQRTNGSPYLSPQPLAINVFLRDRISGTTTLVSGDPADVAEANADSMPAGISTNGQYALFESGASNLVAGDGDGITNTDIFVRDVASRITTLVTVATNGADGNGPSSGSAITPDGRYVVFSSSANNLVANDTNGIADVFVRDMQLGVTRLVSVGAKGTNYPYNPLGNIGGMPVESILPAITPDGRYVVFMSTATNLVPGFVARAELFLRDLSNNTTVCVSSNAHQYIFGNGNSFLNLLTYNDKISDDGQMVVFQASASNSVSFATTNGFIFRHHVQAGVDDLVASNAVIPFAYDRANTLDMTPDGRFVAFIGYTNSGTGVFVWDGQTGTTVLASVDTNGAEPARLDCDFPVISSDGRYVVFASTATTLTTNSVGAGYHFYRRDLQAGITELVDAGTNGTAPARNLVVADCAVSDDGRFVTFDCADPDLVANDGNNASDVFVRDFSTETTELISSHASGLASQTSVRGYGGIGGSLSADGRYVAFAASGSGLVDNYTNSYREIIVRDLLTQSNFLVSADPGGFGDASGDSLAPVISADGHYVAFASYATNLVSNIDTNVNSDVFVRDLQAPATTLLSVSANGAASRNGGSFSPSISVDGRYILFLNAASALVRDQLLATNYIVASNGVTAASMTPDGRYVAFYGTPTAGSPQLYVWDSQLKATIFTSAVASVSKLNISSNGQWIAYIASSSLQLLNRINNSNRTVSTINLANRVGMRFSQDGNSFVYATRANNSVDDTNSITTNMDVYVYDIPAGTNFLVSRSFYTGKAASGTSDSPDISADGRYIVYASDAPDIVSADDNGVRDVFLYDRQTATTTLLSAGGQVLANAASLAPVFTGDGQTVLFHSWGSGITANDFNHNDDLFLMKIASTNGPPDTNAPPAFSGEIVYAPGSAGQGPTIKWAANPGTSYEVQYKDNLTDADWKPVSGTVVIDSGVGSIIDGAPNPDHRFYRIVAH